MCPVCAHAVKGGGGGKRQVREGVSEGRQVQVCAITIGAVRQLGATLQLSKLIVHTHIIIVTNLHNTVHY